MTASKPKPLPGFRVKVAFWLFSLSGACAVLPSSVPLADSSNGFVPLGPQRDRKPRSDAGTATVSVEEGDESDVEIEIEAAPDEPEVEQADVATADAGDDCGDGGAITWPGEYYGNDSMTTAFEGFPPNTMTDDKAHTRVEQGSGDRVVISIVDSSKGDVMCALDATVDGDSAELSDGQTCFGQGDSAPDIISGRAQISCKRLTLHLSAATEIEIENDVRAGEIEYHFEGDRR